MRHRADKLIEDWNAANGIQMTVEALSNDEMTDYIIEHKIPCPGCGKSDFTGIRKFNMMFKTFQGVTEDSTTDFISVPRPLREYSLISRTYSAHRDVSFRSAFARSVSPSEMKLLRKLHLQNP